MAPTLPGAELISNFISCGLYGIYIVTLGMAGRVLLMTASGRMRNRAEIHWMIISTSTVLFIGATLDLVLALQLTYEAFVLYDGPGGPLHVFGHASGFQNVAKSICVFVQTLAGDFILIYRCWFVNDKSWWILVPGVIWIADIACAIGILINQLQIHSGQVNSSHVQWGLSFFSLTICTNIISTSMIVWRIWLVEKQNQKYALRDSTRNRGSQSTLSSAMRNIVESGMIYTVASILELAAFSTGSTWNYPASALSFHSVGITFNLILIRGAALRTNRNPTVASTAIQLTTGNGTTPHSVGVPPSMLTATNVDMDDKPNDFMLSHLSKNRESVSV
ncbi:hypothetical protein FB45DRAFT_315611 [Roridomyces roridus]|uniref:Uncharacterized protein n=1 Tax=Roridomyces roridus TaxID=1738132 RepID=A0AAD7B645_9AGAR|nr:hypothetical protein FB45DRAFT_315611 [Roridomyces roridus]